MAFTDDYVEVADRLAAFHAKYPQGRITRVGEPQIVELPRGVDPSKQRSYVLYTAAAYRAPDDPVPAIGTAWEPWPGPTPFTKDSEMMNAETSAWGRAIIAAGIPSKKIASREEVVARSPDAKPSLKDTVDSNSFIKQAKETFDATEDPFRVALSRLDIGGQAWVLNKVTKLPVKKTVADIEAVISSLSPSQQAETKRIATNLFNKKAELLGRNEGQMELS